ncbi:MAG: FeoB-associated Cys-rich membrane protein [Pyrinomonadaceae bacterium]|nr:FeoB-associated Cys-rich membrane protein [Sphingobacteriaceae bacterium]
MKAQEILMILIFAAAVFYVARMIYKNLKAKNGCASNCKCGIDFSDVKIPKS